MTLPVSGNITIGMVATELKIGLPLNLGDSRVRTLAGKPSGAINLGDLRGKSAYTPPSLTCDTWADGATFSEVGVFADASATVTNFEVFDGEAPFTVTCTRISGSNEMGVLVANPPTFYASGVTNWSYNAVFRVVVKDNRGNTTAPVDVDVNLRAGSAV